MATTAHGQSLAFPQEARPTLFWRLQIGGWLALLVAVQWLLLQSNLDWRTATVGSAVRQSFGFFATLLLRRVYQRWPTGSQPLTVLMRRMIVYALLFGLADAAITEWILRELGIELVTPMPHPYWGLLALRTVVYAAWSFLYFWVREWLHGRDMELHLARLEAASREAELVYLRGQVSPHFLCNGLSSVLAEFDDNPQQARTIMEALADYLHFSLRQPDRLVALGEELHAVESYLQVEKCRFEEGLQVRIDVEDMLRLELVPPAVLQPLVENAIKHGMKTSPGPLRLEIIGRMSSIGVELMVRNSGEWIKGVSTGAIGQRPSGIGLSNLRRRLALLYAEQAELESKQDGGMVQVMIRLPRRSGQARAVSA